MTNARKLSQPQLENYVLERYKQGYDPETISRLLLGKYGMKRNYKNVVKIILNCEKFTK